MVAAEQALKAVDLRYKAGVATLFEVRQTRTDFVDAKARGPGPLAVLLHDVALDYYTGEISAASVLGQ